MEKIARGLLLLRARRKYPPYKDWTEAKVQDWEKLRFGYVFQREKQIFKDLMGDNNHGFVLDLACGSGRYTTLFNPASQYVGLDFSPSMLKLSRKRNPRHDFILADAFHLPFRNNVFNLVFACRFVHHYDKLSGFYMENDRVLKQDGAFMFDVTHKLSLPYLLAKLLHITLHGKDPERELNHVFTPQKVRRDFFLPSVAYSIIPTRVSRAIDNLFSRLLPSRSFWKVTKT